MKNKWIWITIGVLLILFIGVSIFLEGPDKSKMYLLIKNDSIPKTIEVGDIFTIEVDTNLHKSNLTFASSNSDIALVNDEGLVTVLKKGEVTIYAMSVYEENDPQQDKVKLKIK